MDGLYSPMYIKIMLLGRNAKLESISESHYNAIKFKNSRVQYQKILQNRQSR